MTRAQDGIAKLRYFPVIQVTEAVNGWYSITLACSHVQARRACVTAPGHAHCKECPPYPELPFTLCDRDRVIILRTALFAARIDTTGATQSEWSKQHNAAIDEALRKTVTPVTK